MTNFTNESFNLTANFLICTIISFILAYTVTIFINTDVGTIYPLFLFVVGLFINMFYYVKEYKRLMWKYGIEELDIGDDYIFFD